MTRGLAALAAAVCLLACGESEPARTPASATVVRAARRAFHGAPPVIPHPPLGAECTACHNERGLAVEGLGFAPAMPHEVTPGLSDVSRCAQCHVFRATDELFVRSEFVGLAGGAPGPRAYAGAPPVLPHPAFMRENCLACHSGEGAREELRTTHPERTNCSQCHVEQVAVARFER